MDEHENLGFWGRVGVVIGFLSSPAVVNALLVLIGLLGISAGVTALVMSPAWETGGFNAGLLFLAAAVALGQLKKP